MTHFIENIWDIVTGKRREKAVSDLFCLKKYNKSIFNTHLIRATSSIVEYDVREGLKFLRRFVQVKYNKNGKFPFMSETIENYGRLGFDVQFYWNITHAQWEMIKNYLGSFASGGDVVGGFEMLMIHIVSNEHKEAEDSLERFLREKQKVKRAYALKLKAINDKSKKEGFERAVKNYEREIEFLDKIRERFIQNTSLNGEQSSK